MPMSPIDPSTLQPGRVAGALCKRPVEGPGMTVAFPCSRAQGHDEPPLDEPCYAVEIPASRRRWQEWAAARLGQRAQDGHVHRRIADPDEPGLLRCMHPDCDATWQTVDDDPAAAPSTAQQFSAATGAQARIREAQQETADKAGPPPTVVSTSRRTIHDDMQPGPVEETPLIEVETKSVHIASLDELELGDYVIDFDEDSPPTTGLTVMRVGRA